jgi:ketosteroid isomerase-like protein
MQDPKKPSDVLRAWFDRVWCQRDEAAIDELLAPDGEVYGIGPDPMVGPNAFKGFWRAMNATFAAVEFEVVDAIDTGERAYVRCRGTLTHGERALPFEGGCLCDVRDGVIRRAWNCWDFVSLMAAMGSLPVDAFARACAGERFAADVGRGAR